MIVACRKCLCTNVFWVTQARDAEPPVGTLSDSDVWNRSVTFDRKDQLVHEVQRMRAVSTKKHSS